MLRIDDLRSNGKRPVPTPQPARFEPLVVSEHDRAQLSHVSVASVARVAVPFWSLAGATALGAIFVFWALLRGTGTVGRFERFVDDSTGLKHFHVMSVAVLVGVALFVTFLVVVAIALTLAAAIVYNLLAMSTGGIEVRYRALSRRRPQNSRAVNSRSAWLSSGHIRRRKEHLAP